MESGEGLIREVLECAGLVEGILIVVGKYLWVEYYVLLLWDCWSRFVDVLLC